MGEWVLMSPLPTSKGFMIKGKKIAVFDLEIKASIDGKSVKWTDFDKMGISVGVAFFFETMSYKIYLDDNIMQMPDDLNACDLVSGFNILGFDVPLLKATTGKLLNFRAYDLLAESRRAFGVNQFAKGFKLDNHLEHTFGKSDMKLANGAEAPIMFQQNRMGELITYCVSDVAKECKLFLNAWQGLEVKNPNGSRVLPNPQQFFQSTMGELP